MRARRRDPIGSRVLNSDSLAFVLTPTPPADLHLGLLTGQRALDKRGAIVMVRNPATLVTKPLNVHDNGVCRQAPAASSAHRRY
jgi:hypothetical protein